MIEDRKKPFSVLMSVYFREDPIYLEEALISLVDQTVLPSEIVLVEDGPLTKELYDVISRCKMNFPIPLVSLALEKNMGLGMALNKGLALCEFDIVARMDSDDISANNRFELQYNFMLEHNEYAVVGASLEDFHRIPGDLGVLRVLPQTGEKLLKYSKYRSPVNHATAMFKKAAILDSGNYDGDILFHEDYSLFIRLLRKGYKIFNMNDVLYYVRVGSGVEAIKRRTGSRYIKNEIKFLKFALKIGHLSYFEFLSSLILKVPIRMLPPRLVYLLYKNFFRKTKNADTV